MAGHSVVTLRGHAHTTTATFGAPDTVFDGSNCSSGVVRWCAHHLQHLGSPWGIGGNAPHTPGMAGHCLVTLGGHTHTTTTTFRVADTVFDCGSGGVRWCARHPQHLGSPWGIGGNAHTPQGWQDTAELPWGSTHTQHRNHIICTYHTIRIAVRGVVR